RRHTSATRDWSSDVCSSDLTRAPGVWRTSPAIASMTSRRRPSLKFGTHSTSCRIVSLGKPYYASVLCESSPRTGFRGSAREDAETALSSSMREHGGRSARPDDRTERLSRFLALVLRHKPDSVGIALDSSGFAEIEELANAIAAQPGCTSVTDAALRAVAAQDTRR